MPENTADHAAEARAEDDWTQAHWVTRNSVSEGDTYRCWMDCRCGWVGSDLPDGNIPTTHRATLEHYREAWQAAQQSEHDCEFGCASDMEHLQRAYDEVVAEYADYRRQMRREA